MAKLLVLALAAASTPMAAAKVWVNVYQYDGKTPLEAVDSNHPGVYPELMAGTRLTLVISSDSSEYFLGHLRLSWEDTDYAELRGRGYMATRPGSTAFAPNYKGSCLDAAGTKARARDYMGPRGIGLEFSSDHTLYNSGGHPAFPGDWFIFDYHATQAGSCVVGLYDLFAPRDVPIQTLSFAHVPSRDFNRDTIVDLKDFALFASHWGSASDPHAPDKAASDLNADGHIDIADLASFSRYWLKQADANAVPANADTAVAP